VNSCIFTFLFILKYFNIFIQFILVMSFDACIVTITWARLCVVISLWVICLTFVELFSLALVEDRDMEVRVSFYKL
jgi:hypothetical protein